MSQPRTISDDAAKQIAQLRADGVTIREIADMLGISNASVSRYEHNWRRLETVPFSVDEKYTIPEPEPEKPRPHGYEMPKRDAPAYDVKIYNVGERADFEYAQQFKYYPNIWDLCRLCEAAGVPRAGTLNFLDHDDCFARGVKKIRGEIQSLSGAKLGEFLITKLTEEPVHPQELFR